MPEKTETPRKVIRTVIIPSMMKSHCKATDTAKIGVGGGLEAAWS